jgi:hypothetical protein
MDCILSNNEQEFNSREYSRFYKIFEKFHKNEFLQKYTYCLKYTEDIINPNSINQNYMAEVNKDKLKEYVLEYYKESLDTNLYIYL